MRYTPKIQYSTLNYFQNLYLPNDNDDNDSCWKPEIQLNMTIIQLKQYTYNEMNILPQNQRWIANDGIDGVVMVDHELISNYYTPDTIFHLVVSFDE